MPLRSRNRTGHRVNEVVNLARGVIVAGISGEDLDDAAPRFGGYLLFPSADAPIERVRALTDALRARHSGAAPIVAIDQEGGAVMRLRNGVEPIPSMMALGAADGLELAERAGEQIAFDLRRAGVTLDFAPVLDLALEAENSVIGTRSFGADPRRVAALGGALGQGLRNGGILPCYKHFPGHGSTAVDSHEALPVVDADERTLRARDLLPFAALAPEAPAMMSAHVVVRAFHPARPATLSHRIAGDLLRGELGFRGALFTDCLEMGAIGAAGVAAGVEALAAGADLLVFSHRPDFASAAVDAIADAVARGTLARERLEEAYGRANALRAAGAPPRPVDAIAPHPGVGREVGRRAVTLVRGIGHADPIASLAVSFGSGGAALEREAPALALCEVSIDPAPDEMRGALTALETSGRRPLLLARRAHRHPGQVAAIARILDRYPDALVVSLLEPFDVPLFGAARHLLATCGDGVASMRGLADVIFGGSLPGGRLPL